jgi:signal transduction histidine kinase
LIGTVVVAPERSVFLGAHQNGAGLATTAAFAPPEPRIVRPNLLALVAIAVVGCAVPVRSAVIATTTDDIDLTQVALLDWITIPFVLAGLVAWWRRPDSRLGPLMIAGGFASGLSALQLTHVDALYTIGAVFDILPAAFFLHVCLAFPDGRLRSRFEQVLVVVAYSAAIGLQLVKMALGSFGPNNLIALGPWPSAAADVQHVQLLTISATCLAGAFVLVDRRRHTGRRRRRSLELLISSFAIGLVMIAALFIDGDLAGPGFQQLQRATLIVIGLSPIAFLVGLLDERLGRSAVADLMLDLRGDPPPRALRAAFARALKDPSLTLAYWLPDFHTYVDLDGKPVDLSQEEGRTATVLDRNGSRVAALVHDKALDDEPELLEAVGAAAGISLENARLQAELRARLVELTGSRARVIDAGQKERQRLERNLHDGAQQRLIALSLQLSILEQKVGEQHEVRAELDQARREIALSLEELRDVARGIHPAVLTGHGLKVALESLAARAPVPVRLTVDVEQRLPERVEVAAYYVVSESLTNIGKHAEARDASVRVAKTASKLVVEVVDDGIGGADTEGGTGIRGLADRVEALGGRLRIWTPRGGGTRVEAEIPCA